MEARAKLLGHPIHQMLIVLPLGSLAMSVIFDVIAMIIGSEHLHDAAFFMIGGGVVSGVIAAVFGFIDYSAIPDRTRAKRVGRFHAVGNVGVLLLFGVSWLLRFDAPPTPEMLPIALSIAGAALSGITGWLGGELVNRHAVGVHDDASLNASSSLARRR